MADGRHDDDYALSDEQKAAVAELSRSNVYAKQSKWKTLHELPIAEKMAVFQGKSFLSYAVIIAVVVVIVAAFGVSYLTKGPRAELSVEGINMGGYADQLDRLGSDFVKAEKISDSRLVQMDTSISLGDSAKCAGRFRTSARHGLRRADQHDCHRCRYVRGSQ